MSKRRAPINPEYESYEVFRGCSRRDLRFLSALSTRIELPAGRVLARQGEHRREFVVVVRGTADLRRDGRLIERLGPGNYYGEFALLAGIPQPATVTAHTPLTVDVMAERDFRCAFSLLPSMRAHIGREFDRRAAAWFAPEPDEITVPVQPALTS
jgi:CRP-like cAMP-binding protein